MQDVVSLAALETAIINNTVFCDLFCSSFSSLKYYSVNLFNSLLLTGEIIEYKYVAPLFPALPLGFFARMFTLAYTRYASFVHVLPFNSFKLYQLSLCLFSLFLQSFFVSFCFNELLTSLSRLALLGNEQPGKRVHLRRCQKKGTEARKGHFSSATSQPAEYTIAADAVSVKKPLTAKSPQPLTAQAEERPLIGLQKRKRVSFHVQLSLRLALRHKRNSVSPAALLRNVLVAYIIGCLRLALRDLASVGALHLMVLQILIFQQMIQH